MGVYNLICYLTIGIILLSCYVNGATVLQKETLTNPFPVYQLDVPADGEGCTQDLQKIFEPAQLAKLSKMITLSGKSLNDLGQFEGCSREAGFEYALLSLALNGMQGFSLSVGLCTPKSCATAEEYSRLTKWIGDMAQASGSNGTYAFVTFPTQVNESTSKNAGFWVTMFIFAMIVTFMMIGLLVEFTDAANKRVLTQDEKKLLRLEDQKTKIGMFFYSWSPANNIVKLFTVDHNADNKLAILNGMRVISISWVILGHAYSFDFMFPVTNIMTTLDITKPFTFMFVAGGIYAVDTFFFLSGLLTFYLLTSKFYQKRGAMGLKNF